MLKEREVIDKIINVNITNNDNNSLIIKYNNLYFSLFLLEKINTFPNIFVELKNNKLIHYTYFIRKYNNNIIKLCKILNNNFINYNKILNLNMNSIIYKYYYKEDFNIYDSLPKSFININIPINKRYILNNNQSFFILLKKIKRVELLKTFINEYKIFYNNYCLIYKIYLFYKYWIIKNKPIINIINFLL